MKHQELLKGINALESDKKADINLMVSEIIRWMIMFEPETIRFDRRVPSEV